MRTLFITSFHVMISRNILATALMAELTRDPDIRIILCVPDYKRSYFQSSFGGPQVTVEGVNLAMRIADRILRQFALLLLPTRTMAIKRYWEALPEKSFLAYALKSAVARLMGGSRLVGKLLRRADQRFGSDEHAAILFERYHADVVFVTDIQNEADLILARQARRRGVRVIGMVRSWDNPTSKGFIRFVPDLLIVQNEMMKGDITRYHDIPLEKIAVVGIPHYDRYLTYRPIGREALLASLGLDPQKRLIVVAPIGDRHVRDRTATRSVLQALERARASGRIPENIQVVLRFPPMDTLALDGFIPPPWMVFDRPGIRFREGSVKDSELDRASDNRLVDLISASDLVITGPSTISIDAAFFDKPVILTALQDHGERYWSSVLLWYDLDHFQPILQSHGVCVVKTEEELANSITAYLQHPETDAPGRARIIREQCGRIDGRSTERLLELVRRNLGQASPVHG